MVNLDLSELGEFSYHETDKSFSGFLENNDHFIAGSDVQMTPARAIDLQINDIYYIDYYNVSDQFDLDFNLDMKDGGIVTFEHFVEYLKFENENSPLLLDLVHLKDGNKEVIKEITVDFADKDKTVKVIKTEEGFDMQIQS